MGMDEKVLTSLNEMKGVYIDIIKGFEDSKAQDDPDGGEFWDQHIASRQSTLAPAKVYY